MIVEDALKIVTAVLAPNSLSKLQEQVFRGSWHNQSYIKIEHNTSYQESYLKDVGSELWQLLSQKLEIKVTKLNLREAVMQYVQLQQMSRPTLPQRHVDWGEAPDVSQVCGRAVQLTKLKKWVMEDCRMLLLVGIGGIGKTTLAAQLAQQLVDTDLFEVIVWRSLKQAPPLQELLTDLMSAIAPDQLLPQRLDAKMRQLQEQLRHRRCLLILDNVEAVLQSKELVGTYRSGYEDYSWFFQQLGEGRHQSSVLLTSREIIPQISIQAGSTAAVRLWRLEPLSMEAGKSILAAKGLDVQTEQPQHVNELIQCYQGNPLALKIVATQIKESFNGSISAFLAQNTLLFKDMRDLLASQLARLSLLEQRVINWFACQLEAVSAIQLQADLLPSLTPAQLQDALESLDRRSLIEKHEQNLAPTLINSGSVSYTQQAVVREYVTSQLVEQMCQEIEQVQVDCLKSHSLLKTQAKDYIKDVQPTLELLEVLERKESLKNLQLDLLKLQQIQVPLQQGYFDENSIDLVRQLRMDLSHLEFSNLTSWSADLQMVNLNETHFSYVDLSYSVFIQSIANILNIAFNLDGKYIASHDNGKA